MARRSAARGPVSLSGIALHRLRRRRGFRALLAAVVAALSLAVAAHHLVPMAPASAMAGMGHEHDQAMPMAAACLAVIEGAFVLGYVGAVIRVGRSPRRRPRAATRRRPRLSAPAARQACRDGPPTYLRLQVLRT